MRVPFVDYPAHFNALGQEFKDMVNDVLFVRADLILRDDLVEFERDFARFLGSKFAVGLNNCTDALFLSLKAAGIGAGHEVVTVAHTFIATVASIVHVGATPVLCDIGDDDLMDTSLLESLVTPRTKAILPVHLNGRICDMDAVMAVARKHNLLVIEDAAQALGGTCKGKKAGAIGLAGCFSFYPAKLLGAAGDAGMMVTDDEELARKVRLLRDHGRLNKANDFAFFGYNSRLDNIQAAMLNFKLKRLPGWLERRRAIARVYDEGLRDLPLRIPVGPEADNQRYDVYQNYAIHSERRDELVAFLKEKGVETLISWPKPLHHNESLNLNFELPRTDELCRRIVSLPMNTEIDDAQVHYVVECIREFYRAAPLAAGSSSASART
ncbi:MAG: DegT/DnrJ/EryC1/StrS family aminotransferase [Candidatus Eremiobacterota bacterium]